MTIKINALQVENVKRVKAVALEPSANGLTVIGGKNGQGKTSVLDAVPLLPQKAAKVCYDRLSELAKAMKSHLEEF